MRSVITGPNRYSDDSVRQRMDALFGPGQQPTRPAAVRNIRPAPEPPHPPADPADPVDPPDAAPPPQPPPPAATASRRLRAAVAGRLPLAFQERLDLDRRALVGLSVLLVLALGYGAQHFWAGRPEPVAVPVAEGTVPVAEGAAAVSATPSAEPAAGGGPVPATPGPSPGASRPAGLVVDVAGRVREPGLRTLPPGARVQDAVQAAGGPVAGTDLTALNLARPLTDGEEIVVGAPAAAPGLPPAAQAAARARLPPRR